MTISRHQQVAAQAADGEVPDHGSGAQGQNAAPADDAGGLAAAQDFGAIKKIKPMYQFLVKEGPQGFGPAFHQEALHLAGSQEIQAGREGDPAGVRGQPQDLGAGRREGAARWGPGWCRPPRWGPLI